MKYWNIESDLGKLIKLYENASLIPFFGAGFSSGSKAHKEVVPDGRMATNLMRDMVLNATDRLKEEDIKDFDFNKMAEYFFRLVPENIRDDFFRDYFTEATLSDELKEFLALEWSYGYTFNVDDAIERTHSFSPIIPYRQLKERIRDSKVLYKLHGDAFTEIHYKDKDIPAIVFSQAQYLRSITSEKNASLLNNLKADFMQNNLLFIGCSLTDEEDIKYVANEFRENVDSVYRIVIRRNMLSPTEEFALETLGVNCVLLVKEYEHFYSLFCNEVKKAQFSGQKYNDRFKNPQIKINGGDKKQNNIAYLSGENIFDFKNNVFYRYHIQIIRQCVSEIGKKLDNCDCIVLKGRRFSGKTTILSFLCEQQKKYTRYFFSSTSLPDEIFVRKLLEEEKNCLFIFDSNSLSSNVYLMLSDSKKWLKQNKNKLIIAVNSNDNFITNKLEAYFLEIQSIFVNGELKEFNYVANEFALIKRKHRMTNLDYIKTLADEQHIQMPLFDSNIMKKGNLIDKSDHVIILLLSVMDKIFLGDIIALNITFARMDTLIKRLSLVIEKVDSTPVEREKHSSQKLIHNSKRVLLSLLWMLSDEEIIAAILHIVRRLKNDSERKRLFKDVILFDTLNQLFGRKKGAGKLIFMVYEALEKELSQSHHYWLQRAKSVYRLKSDDIDELQKAYEYAKKVYIDSYNNEQMAAKAALSLAIICCLICKLNTDDHGDFYEEAIEKAHEAVFSDYYNYNIYYFKSELKVEKRNGNSYDLLMQVANDYLNFSDAKETYIKSANEVLRKLIDVKKEFEQKHGLR